MTNFFSSKFKALAEDSFKFDESGRKFSKTVENAAVKGKIAFYEQFLLLPLCFQKTCTADTLKQGLVWERVICFLQMLMTWSCPNFLTSDTGLTLSQQNVPPY